MIDFTSLNIDIPENILKYTPQNQQSIYDYLKQMNETQQKTYLIAKEHLGTSFNIMKSNGYKDWIKECNKR